MSIDKPQFAVSLEDLHMENFACYGCGFRHTLEPLSVVTTSPEGNVVKSSIATRCSNCGRTSTLWQWEPKPSEERPGITLSYCQVRGHQWAETHRTCDGYGVQVCTRCGDIQAVRL